MARLRLRFLLQEFDLTGPEVVIGRSPDCHITIQDPMVSRQHARIRIEGDHAFVTDLNSRNGVQVNERHCRHEQALHDGDRIRIGTQELVFSAVQQRSSASRVTGYLTMCHACGIPFPDSATHCPHCGGVSHDDTETLSGVFIEPQRGWTLQLLCDVAHNALRKGRLNDTDRLMRRVMHEVESQLDLYGEVQADLLHKITEVAVGLAHKLGATEWATWSLSMLRRSAARPSQRVLNHLADLDMSASPDLQNALHEFITWYRYQKTDSKHRALADNPDTEQTLAQLELLITKHAALLASHAGDRDFTA